jgi:hypothetical protein
MRRLGFAALALGIAVLACHPPEPASPPAPSPTNPVAPSRQVSQDILDASIVSDAAWQADVTLDTGALPARAY